MNVTIMLRFLRTLGVVLMLAGVAILAVSIALQFDAGLAASMAKNSTCNSAPCTASQLASMALYVGPICFLGLGGFGLALLKVPIAGLSDQPAA